MKKFKMDYKWELILMLWFAFFLNQGDRQVYGAIVGDIQEALGLTGMQAGWVVTVFTVVYGCLAQHRDSHRCFHQHVQDG